MVHIDLSSTIPQPYSLLPEVTTSLCLTMALDSWVVLCRGYYDPYLFMHIILRLIDGSLEQ